MNTTALVKWTVILLHLSEKKSTPPVALGGNFKCKQGTENATSDICLTFSIFVLGHQKINYTDIYIYLFNKSICDDIIRQEV